MSDSRFFICQTLQVTFVYEVLGTFRRAELSLAPKLQFPRYGDQLFLK
jgi:hypothetical protein